MSISSVRSSPSPPSARCYGAGINGHPTTISLTELLSEAELSQYEDLIRLRLKIIRIEHLRDVRDTDLSEIGMSKPEQRRLFKVFNKYCPSSITSKLKQKVLQRKAAACPVDCDSTSISMTSSPFPMRKCTSSDKASSSSAVDDEMARKTPYPTAADDGRHPGDEEQHIIPSSNIILCRQLGKGEFGTVWQGVWTTTAHHASHRWNTNTGTPAKIQVAVKQVTPAKMLSSPLDFVREAAIMHRIHHDNIVRFFGVVLETQTIMLVTELAPSRSLAECLKEERSAERFSIIHLCEFAQQICLGMSYLETNRFIHRDLAARNILVFSTHKVKISDFGLSRALGTSEEYYRGNFSTNLKLPIAWCAPECINYLKFTTASDVWAYGITLWEMFTYGLQPWAGLNGQQIFDAVNTPRMCRPECPDACPVDYYNLMQKCWKHEPEHRPKFSEILDILPTMEPERVVAVKACQDGQLDHLQYGMDSVITVLNKRPVEYPDGYYWKGILKNGHTGLFLPTNTVAYLESQRPGMPATASVSAAYYSKPKPAHQSHQNGHKLGGGGFLRTAMDSIGGLARRSAGKAGINVCPKEKNGRPRPLISHPQNDFRHTGHLGLDGLSFGDVPVNFTAKNMPKHPTIHSFQHPTSTNTVPKQQRHHRFDSYSLDTACLLSMDDYDGEGENGHSFHCSDDDISGADLDDVQPVSLVCGDSGGWLLEEVLQALDQRPSGNEGCTNPAARFSVEDGQEKFGSIDTDAPKSPNSILDEEDAEETIGMNNDKERLFLAQSSRKNHLEKCGKRAKEDVVKPLSSGDSKMLDQIDKLACKLSTKALDKERERLEDEKRRLGLMDDYNDHSGLNRTNNAERSPSPTDSMKRQLMRKFRCSSPNSPNDHKPTFTDTLAKKRHGGDMKVSPEAENAYKTLIEGKMGTSNCVLLPREERDDPQRPSVEEEHDEDTSTTEDETNPLRMLRNEGANVVRRFTRQGSGRRQQLIEKPTPPVRRKCQSKCLVAANSLKAQSDSSRTQADSMKAQSDCVKTQFDCTKAQTDAVKTPSNGSIPAQNGAVTAHAVARQTNSAGSALVTMQKNGSDMAANETNGAGRIIDNGHDRATDHADPRREIMSTRRPLPPPPPVPPRASPRLGSNRKVPASSTQKQPAPAIPPKPKFASSSSNQRNLCADTSKKAEEECAVPSACRIGNECGIESDSGIGIGHGCGGERGHGSKHGNESETENGVDSGNRIGNGNGFVSGGVIGDTTRMGLGSEKPSTDQCPSFSLEDINKYDLLDFVLSGLPESKITEERHRLISMEKADRSSPSSSASTRHTAIPHRPVTERSVVSSRTGIVIDDDAVHV